MFCREWKPAVLLCPCALPSCLPPSLCFFSFPFPFLRLPGQDTVADLVLSCEAAVVMLPSAVGGVAPCAMPLHGCWFWPWHGQAVGVNMASPQARLMAFHHVSPALSPDTSDLAAVGRPTC